MHIDRNSVQIRRDCISRHKQAEGVCSPSASLEGGLWVTVPGPRGRGGSEHGRGPFHAPNAAAPPARCSRPHRPHVPPSPARRLLELQSARRTRSTPLLPGRVGVRHRSRDRGGAQARRARHCAPRSGRLQRLAAVPHAPAGRNRLPTRGCRPAAARLHPQPRPLAQPRLQPARPRGGAEDRRGRRPQEAPRGRAGGGPGRGGGGLRRRGGARGGAERSRRGAGRRAAGRGGRGPGRGHSRAGAEPGEPRPGGEQAWRRAGPRPAPVRAAWAPSSRAGPEPGLRRRQRRRRQLCPRPRRPRAPRPGRRRW